ncbi:hypothetical protein T310_8955, partial [Rasamsonia emersonii CBS 393.64]
RPCPQEGGRPRGPRDSLLRGCSPTGASSCGCRKRYPELPLRCRPGSHRQSGLVCEPKPGIENLQSDKTNLLIDALLASAPGSVPQAPTELESLHALKELIDRRIEKLTSGSSDPH